MSTQLDVPKDRPKLVTSEAVIAGLNRLYPADRYACVEQVANSTGFSVKGWADLIAVGLWPSRGLDITGIEVKVSRQDWLKELRKGGKAENVARFCDYWFVAVGDETIVRDGELPSAWGLIAPNKKGELYHKVQATKNEAPEFNRGFLAAVLRRVAAPNADTLKAEYQRGKDDARKEYRDRFDDADAAAEKSMLRDYERLKKVCADFEKASGINLLYEWHGKEIGAAARILRHDRPEAQINHFVRVSEEARRLAEQAEKSAATLRGEDTDSATADLQTLPSGTSDRG